MSNLYTMTTNRAAIRDLFNMTKDSSGNLPPMPGVFPDYPAPGSAQCWCRPRPDHGALGHGAAAQVRRAARHQYPQYRFTALARLAEAGEPMPGAGE
jgi:hypothetical protein